MPAPSDDEIDYLLSRGKLGGSQRRRILDGVLTASREGFWARWRGRLTWSAGGLVLATGAAAVLLLAGGRHNDTEPFRAKGWSDAPLISVSCLDGQLSRCPIGSRVAFALEGGRDAGFLTAYAQPVRRGERIWYLANESVGAPQSDASVRVVGKAALVGEGQPPGSYRVHAIFTRHPVAREALASVSADEALARLETELVVP
jgi:hypothetical protein